MKRNIRIHFVIDFSGIDSVFILVSNKYEYFKLYSVYTEGVICFLINSFLAELLPSSAPAPAKAKLAGLS